MSSSIHVELTRKPGGLGDCPGLKLAGIACDIRGNGEDRPDLALLTSEGTLRAAGVFTQNDICAPPVLLCRDILSKRADAIGGCVVNSGNANACTGEQGMADAREMSATAQFATGIGAPFLVASTGRIGRRLPMDRVNRGIEQAAPSLSASPEASLRAADAILTSDTRRKVATARVAAPEGVITVAGMAKGAGMIEPNMATMLAYLATDADASSALLREVLLEANAVSFNAITVDGDMSTNDSVFLIANGHSGIIVSKASETFAAFKKAVHLVCDALADWIVGDGEKVTKAVDLHVEAAASDAAAEKVARAVGNSLLVKTSWFGNDPNWGRIADAAGYARVGLVERQLDIFYDEVPALLGGRPQDERLADWQRIVSKPRFRITIRLNQGAGQFRLRASDLSEGYVNFNKSE